jgi:fido (protein-threonine AMPylation protein)
VPTPWEEPPGSEARIQANVQRLLEEIVRLAGLRRPPTVVEAQGWHRNLYEGIARPFPYYAGEVRDSDERFPELIDYEVEVGGRRGVPAVMVPAVLAQFETSAQAASARLDAEIPVGVEIHDLTPRQLHGVLTLCALLHGEWVRIHPFANGNGRTARLWANWAALRYGLPPFVTIKPRPGQPYGIAAMASMYGDHQVTVALFHQMLRAFLSDLP